MNRAAGWLLGACLLSGCAKGSAPAESPREAAPASAGEPAPAPAPEPAAPHPLTLPPLGAGVPAPAASCPPGARLPEARVACPSALPDLARALGDSSLAADSALLDLEACAEFPPGLIRALRAERLPACADQIVEPAAQADGPLDDGQKQLLIALGLAGRLSRLVGAPPVAPPRSTNAELQAYLAQELFPWATDQAKAIGELSRAGAKMRGYARGIVAIEAALADLRFVEMARALPLPVEMQAGEVQTEYYAALDEALEPRKDRARDAALVGLGEFSALGMLESARLEQARQVIARVFAGNRIVALDLLLVPAAPACTKATPEETIASLVESPYALPLLPSAPLTPALVTCVLTRGLPLDLARRLAEEGTPESRSALARAYFELGRTYLTADAFVRATELYGKTAPAATGKQSDRARLLTALARTLSAAPANAADLFLIGPRLPAALGETTLLDELGRSQTTVAGAAAFDAAYLRELTASEGSVSHFKDVAQRYASAQTKLKGKERTLAADRARAAQATAQALEKQLR